MENISIEYSKDVTLLSSYTNTYIATKSETFDIFNRVYISRRGFINLFFSTLYMYIDST